MIKKFLILFIIILYTGCSAPGTALLGPAFTGATTKSVAQASLSFGTNQIIRKIDTTIKESKKEVKKIVKKIENFEINPEHKKLLYFSR
tara:strand:- start:1917 stop:2183 length:267 start_codon:yes stop_codon:yes gene_type:complete